MTKKKLIELLADERASEEDKRIVERIESLLYTFGDDVQIEGLDAIEDFERRGGFNCSVLDSNDKTVLDELKDILAQLRVWVKQQSYAQYGEVVDRMDGKTKVWLKIFLAIIGVFAAAALVFMVLHLIFGDGFLYGYGDEIAEAFGTLDFALGALGFIVERMDDMKKRKVRKNMENAIESGDRAGFISIVNNVVNSQKAGKNSTQIIGNNNTVNSTKIEDSFHHIKIEDNRRYGDGDRK